MINSSDGSADPFKAAAAVLFLLLTPALALTDDARYPAATCAAFLEGREWFAAGSPYLAPSPDDARLAADWRAEAVRLNGGDEVEVAAFIAEERAATVLMFEAMILDGDTLSRDIHDRLAETCAAPPEQAS